MTDPTEVIETLDVDTEDQSELLPFDIPQNDAELDPYFKTIHNLDKQIEEKERYIQYAVETAKHRIEKLKGYRAYYESQMRTYVESTGNKSVKTPFGKVQLRTTDSFDWDEDDDKILKWAKEFVPDAIKVIERADKTIIKAHFKSTGEIPPIVEITSKTSCSVKPDEGAFRFVERGAV